VIIYGAEAWTLQRKEEGNLEKAEMRMLHWILGITLKDWKRDENIRRAVGVANITHKVCEARLWWYGQVCTEAGGGELHQAHLGG
jgi:hypothetical protein